MWRIELYRLEISIWAKNDTAVALKKKIETYLRDR